MTITIEIEGIDALLKKLKPNSLYGKALKEAMEATRVYGMKQLHSRVPKGEGRLEGALTSSLDSHEVPLWAAVGIPHMPLNDGFRYGGALEAGGRYHYRMGTKRRGGKPTRGWWSGVRKSMRNYLRRKMRKVLAAIEQEWNR